jgi:hypothetical protein
VCVHRRSRVWLMAKGKFFNAISDEDEHRLKMGRCSGQSEGEMDRLVRGGWSVGFLGKLLGGGVNPSRVGYFSTRPRMSADGGQTFAFSHRTVTKRYEKAVPAERHYVVGLDKSSANAIGAKFDRSVRVEGRAGGYYTSAGATLPAGVRYSVGVAARVTGSRSGNASAFQRYIEREGAVLYAVGTIPGSAEDRAALFDQIEEMERAGGRVQSRLIMEFPHELPLSACEKILDGFVEEFRHRSLPVHAVIHHPEAQGDARNVHGHLVYHDRPVTEWRPPKPAATAPLTQGATPQSSSDQTTQASEYAPLRGGQENGVEGLQALTGVRSAHIFSPGATSGPSAVSRPIFAPTKSAEVRSKDWVKQLRSTWADLVNAELVRAGINRRFDPRSYAEAGVEKVPTQHLGSAAMALERRGIATDPGAAAVGAELQARLRSAATELGREAAADGRLVGKTRELLRVDAVGASAGAMRSAAIAATAFLEAGETWREAKASRIVAGWDAVDAPRRLLQAGRAGPASLRDDAGAFGEELRLRLAEKLREAQAVEKAAETAYRQAASDMATARKRLEAELLLGRLRRAVGDRDRAEAAPGIDGRRSEQEWQMAGERLAEQMRLRLVDRAAAEQDLRLAFVGPLGKVNDLVAAVKDRRRRPGLLTASLSEELGAAILRYDKIDVGIAALEGDAEKRRRIDRDPALRVRAVRPVEEEEAMAASITSAVLGFERILDLVQGNALAAELAAKHGLLAQSGSHKPKYQERQE